LDSSKLLVKFYQVKPRLKSRIRPEHDKITQLIDKIANKQTNP